MQARRWLLVSCLTAAFGVQAQSGFSDRYDDQVPPRGSTCNYVKVTPAGDPAEVPAGGGTVNIQFDETTGGGTCSHSLTEGPDPSGMLPSATGDINGLFPRPYDISYSIGVNNGPPRMVDAIVLDKDAREVLRYTVSQAGGSTCSYSVVPTMASFDGAGGNSSFSINTTATCNWTITNNSSACITSVSPSMGSGTASIAYSVSSSGSPRSCTLSIVGDDGFMQTFTVNQTALDCSNPSLSPTSLTFSSSAGGTMNVDLGGLPMGCLWSATPNVGWLSVSPTNGDGSLNGIMITATANTDSQSRMGTVNIAGEVLQVTQAGQGCSPTVTPTSRTIASGGASQSFTVNLLAGCEWTASVTSGGTFINITSGSAGTGNGAVNYTVDANTGSARAGAVTVSSEGQMAVHSINQDAFGCNISVMPTAVTGISDTGADNRNFSIVTDAVCDWTTQVFQGGSFITLDPPTSGTGPASLTFDVAANAGGPRTGEIRATLTSNSQIATVFVAQNGVPGCTYTVTPMLLNNVAAGGDTANINISTTAGCMWSSTPNVSWLSLAPPTGTGTGSATLTIDPNPDATPRSGTINIAGRTVTVNQLASQCAYAINPMSLDVGPAGETGSIAVTTGDQSCEWTAVSNDSWLILDTPSGVGDGSVGYTVQPNTSLASRSTTADIAERVLTVNQDAEPGFLINEVQAGDQDFFEIVNLRGSSLNLGLIGISVSGNINQSFALPGIPVPAGGAQSLVFSSSFDVWSPGEPGALGIFEVDTGFGVDFVRWGGSTIPPTGGTPFSGSVITHTTRTHAIGRDAASTDSNAASDWCIQFPSVSSLNGPCVPPVVINEVFPDTPDYFELYNFSTGSVDVTDWSIETNGATAFDIPSRILGSGGYARVEAGMGLVTFPGSCQFTRNPVGNCSFEGGLSGWAVNDLSEPFLPVQVGQGGFSPPPEFGLFSSSPADGSSSLLHGFDGNGPGVIEVSRNVTVPANQPILFFQYRGGWDLFNFCPDCTQNREFRVEIRNTANTMVLSAQSYLLAPPQTFIADTGSLLGSLGLGAFASTSVKIVFVWEIPEEFTGPGFFELDNVSINSIAPGTLFTGPDSEAFGWVAGGSGALTLFDDTATPVDFVRWGTSAVTPPAEPGPPWSGNGPSTTSQTTALGRRVNGADANLGGDWCVQNRSSGEPNPLCEGEFLLRTGFEDNESPL